MIDEQISRARQGTRKATPHFPCLQQSRKHPPWIGSRVRRATLMETCRAQGLLPEMVHGDDWEQPIALCRMLGNSMATNVLLQVMVPLINAVRPELNAVDPWATGRLQQLLKRSAKTERGGDDAEGVHNTQSFSSDSTGGLAVQCIPTVPSARHQPRMH